MASPSGIVNAQNCGDAGERVEYKVISEPSDVIKTYQKTILIDNSAYELILITMKRSFLLAINDLSSRMTFPGVPRQACTDALTEENNGTNLRMTKEKLITSLMESNANLKGLSLAIKGHSTCLVESANSVASCALANRLSKKFNADGPVYVVNNVHMPQDSLEPIDFMTKFNMRVFQFVAAHYKLPKAELRDLGDKESNADVKTNTTQRC